MKNQIDSFFLQEKNKIYDKYQRKVILNDSQNLLVVAAAGSGKTKTIIGKIEYLIDILKYQEKDILVLSFTNETVNNLKEKVSYNVDILTFHKLALRIIRNQNKHFGISNDNLLKYIVDEFFLSYLFIPYQNLILSYFKASSINEIIINGKLDLFKLHIISFIKKIKSNNYSLEKIKKVIKKIIDDSDKIFIILALKIYSIYEEELKSCRRIDFDDMIIYAKNIVRKNRFKRRYKYIIIDEYQDISKIRFDLIKEIINKTNAKLMCVGDDYQSIYGFSGSNLSLFIDFKKYFSNYQRIDIKNTYRNSYQLINIAKKFILRNPYQLRKSIYAKFLLRHPVVLVYYTDLIKTYQNVLDYLYLEDKKDIMVLARYNKDLDKIKKEDSIKYLTVHKSKGLEADNVILLNMSDSYLGFPSKIKEIDCLRMFDNFHEDIPYAEERRLFYVALTRCREKIYILVPKKNPSMFIKEIKRYCVELIIEK